VADLIEKTEGPCTQALKDSGLPTEKIDEAVLVGGSTRVPKVQELVKQLFRREPHKGVNPDEVVALGAAVQAGVLAGDVKDILLLDVTPLSLGIETLGGVMTTLIARNTTIPTRKSEVFTTAADGQTSVEIHVMQGERPMARDNRTLGRFHLVGIPPAPRGVPQIEVTFDIDANGILHVSARDQGTGKEQVITITASTGLTKDEIDRMVKESEAHAAEDTRRRDEIELRNKLDADVYATEKLLSENRDKLDSAEIDPVEAALKEAKSALEEGNAERIKGATEQLQKASFRLGELMYQRTQQGAQPSGDGEAQSAGTNSGGQARSGRDDVVDAEFEETDKSDRR
jgi:molecular chaperone DnaK